MCVHGMYQGQCSSSAVLQVYTSCGHSDIIECISVYEWNNMTDKLL